jgi:hypothetical protein
VCGVRTGTVVGAPSSPIAADAGTASRTNASSANNETIVASCLRGNPPVDACGTRCIYLFTHFVTRHAPVPEDHDGMPTEGAPTPESGQLFQEGAVGYWRVSTAVTSRTAGWCVGCCVAGLRRLIRTRSTRHWRSVTLRLTTMWQVPTVSCAARLRLDELGQTGARSTIPIGTLNRVGATATPKRSDRTPQPPALTS